MSQLALFALGAPTAPAALIGGGRHNYARMKKLMARPVIEAELMQIFRARPNGWQTWSAYRPVIEKHGIGFGLGHWLSSMQRRGLLEEKVIYFGRDFGADRPVSPDILASGANTDW